MGRVDVWYFCTRCKARNKSGPGRLFCPDCGGELRSIGYKVTQRRASTALRHRQGRR